MAKRNNKSREIRRKLKRKRPMLSLCMIAKDEASFLSRCLASVKGLVDEVVVGDTGSSDETALVAREAGARVFDVPWTGDFSVARNTVLGHARGAWILVLDCDEVIAPQDHTAIRNAMAAKSVTGYRMTIRNYALASNRLGWQACDGAYDEEKDYLGWFPTSKVRLFRNDSRIRFEGALHELVEETLVSIDCKVADLIVPIHHYGYVEKDRKDDYSEQALILDPKVEIIGKNARLVKELSRPGAVKSRFGGDQNGGRLTLCMIAKNEADRLGRCLESVQGLVDEIVVVDTGSTDDTVAIAEKYGAKLGYFEWCDDFAAARNESLKLATGDWIMWLDPDDILPRECHQKIRAVMRQGLGKKVAYYWVLDDQGYEPITCLQMRLFPNMPGIEFTMPIHEQITPSLAKLGIICEATDIRVEHTGYSSPEVVGKKQARYLGIIESWLEKHPDDYIVRSHAAITYYIQGSIQKAIDAYQKILDDGQAHKDNNLVIETTATLYLGRCYMRLKQYKKALPYLLDAQKLDDQYAITNLTLGECYTRMNRHEEAFRALDQALKFEDLVTFSATDPVALRYSIRFFNGQNLEATGKLEEAANWYRQASDIDPNRGGALGRLSRVYRLLGKKEDAIRVLDAALACEPDNAQHQFNRGTFYLDAGEMDEAVRWFKRALERNPEMPEPYLNLGYVARRQGDVKTAEEMYRKAIERNVTGYEAQANLGHLLLDQERFAEAGVFLDCVYKEHSELLDISLGLCVVRAYEGNLEQVRVLLGGVLGAVYGSGLQMTVPANASPVELALLLAESGRMLVQQQQAVCARLAYWTANLLNPESQDTALQLAAVYQALGEHWKAVGVYEEWIQKRPTDPELFQNLGVCYEAMGVNEAANMCREQVQILRRSA